MNQLTRSNVSGPQQLTLPLGGIEVRRHTAEDIGHLTARLDAIAEARQQRRIGRDESLEVVAEAFASVPETGRREIARASQSLLHVLEVFSHDRAPSVRGACAYNANAIDRRIQFRLAKDSDPLVVLSLLDGVDIDLDAATWIIDHCLFDTVRLRLAQRRLDRSLLRRLALDPSPAVAAAAQVRLGESRPLRKVA